MSEKVYMIANLNIEDKETYLRYEKGFFPILKKHGGEFITFDDSHEHIEGDSPLSGRVIIFSFPSIGSNIVTNVSDMFFTFSLISSVNENFLNKTS